MLLICGKAIVQVTKLFKVFFELIDAFNFVAFMTIMEMVDELKW
ncbi:hypothetical protein Pint_19420 [Pistacia integerrima]|uniref:Uncharacterized protein n=1 Tax=Pistacia integerrima TaxID=434235 RepID=A0ACC0YV41_9ROSI|nr:hypothetical protein Pint_19420 [Pistacia integerrima]